MGGAAVAGMQEANAALQKKNYSEAAREYRALADEGNQVGMFMLGVLYREGKGAPLDYTMAMKLFRIVTEDGNAVVQLLIGDMYDEGEGVAQDSQVALKWYQLSANQGNAEAQFRTGQMYALGRGVLQDFKEAARWYRLAAGRGNPNAQHKLAASYALGYGVIKNQVAAYALTNISATGDHLRAKEASDYRARIAKGMTAEQLEAGQALSREMSQPGNFLPALDKFTQ
jgi:hypothetical protein